MAERDDGVLAVDARAAGDHVLLGARPRDAAEQRELRGPARAHERLVRAGERLANHLDDPDIVIGGLHEAVGRAAEREVVLVAEVDDAVRGLGGSGDAGEVVEVAAQGLGAGGRDLLGRRVRPREPDDVVLGRQQLRDDGRTDVTTRSGDKDAHVGS